MTRPHSARVGIVSALWVAMSLLAAAQRQQTPTPSARSVAPVDLTGYWVSVVSTEWRYRMMTPPKGDYEGIPLTPAARKIADTWHAPRSGGRMHEGQDIFAPKGTKILSATNGYVYKIGENNLGGQTVSVISSGGRIYYYAHLDEYAPGLKVGDPVTTRTLLGFVGTTGNAQGTPPHLHFGVYTFGFGDAINPLPLITDRTAPAPTMTRTRPTENRTSGRLVSRRI